MFDREKVAKGGERKEEEEEEEEERKHERETRIFLRLM